MKKVASLLEALGSCQVVVDFFRDNEFLYKVK